MNRLAFAVLATAIAIFAASSGVLAAGPVPRITGSDGVGMVLIPEGEFLMGTDDERLTKVAPRHLVYVSSFYMDEYEVTNGRFAEFLNAVVNSEQKAEERFSWVVLRSDLEYFERTNWWPTEIIFENGQYKAFEGYKDLPVITVSWKAATLYCEWAGKRLPTEAEWEKAARGRLVQKTYPWGDAIPTGGVIFSKEWRDNTVPAPVARVGSYLPNGYGLYDMAGNVWEWCSDWYDPEYYTKSPYKDPKGPDKGFFRVQRGGSWFNRSHALMVAHRASSPPGQLADAVGFRCAKDAPDMGKTITAEDAQAPPAQEGSHEDEGTLEAAPAEQLEKQGAEGVEGQYERQADEQGTEQTDQIDGQDIEQPEENIEYLDEADVQDEQDEQDEQIEEQYEEQYIEDVEGGSAE